MLRRVLPEFTFFLKKKNRIRKAFRKENCHFHKIIVSKNSLSNTRAKCAIFGGRKLFSHRVDTCNFRKICKIRKIRDFFGFRQKSAIRHLPALFFDVFFCTFFAKKNSGISEICVFAKNAGT